MTPTNLQSSPAAQALQSQLATLSQRVAVWRERFPHETDELAKLQKDFSTKLTRLNSEGLKLSIGIMGQVKAGKSSFLNALLFDGKPVLPVAATPKTANLTHISYGESPLLTVHFYTLDEWHNIQAQAASPEVHVEAQVARDLLQMAKTQGLDIPQLLAQPTVTLPADDVDGLMAQLNDYVGENGRYTALVKSTEIALPLPELQGYDVVDTPGMNDPVPSRTQKTREYMAQCDVVFFLSRASQFLGQEDMDLLARQLPGHGVKRMVLVAGQLDGTIADDGPNRDSLAKTESNLATRNGRRAADEMEQLAKFRDEAGDTAIAAMLRTLKTPIQSSTFAHGFAQWEPACWSEAMHHTHQNSTEMAAEHWNDYHFTQADWLRIGNFASVQAAYELARQDKQVLLQAQRDSLLSDNRREGQIRLQALADAASDRAKKLKSGDMVSMEKKLKACESRIARISLSVDEVVSRVFAQCDKTVREVQNDLTKNKSSAGNVTRREGTEQVDDSYYVTSWCLNPFSLFREKRWVSRTKSQSYAYIATSDVIEKLVNFAHESSQLLEQKFNVVVKLSVLKADLKIALMNALDTDASIENFDPTEFRNLLQGTLNRLVLPQLQLPSSDVQGAISRRFSGQVREADKIEALTQAQKDTVASIRRDLLAAFEAAVAKLRQQLGEVSQSLTTNFAADLKAEREQLKAAFADKDRELVVYADIVAFCLNQKLAL